MRDQFWLDWTAKAPEGGSSCIFEVAGVDLEQALWDANQKIGSFSLYLNSPDLGYLTELLRRSQIRTTNIALKMSESMLAECNRKEFNELKALGVSWLLAYISGSNTSDGLYKARDCGLNIYASYYYWGSPIQDCILKMYEDRFEMAQICSLERDREFIRKVHIDYFRSPRYTSMIYDKFGEMALLDVGNLITLLEGGSQAELRGNNGKSVGAGSASETGEGSRGF